MQDSLHVLNVRCKEQSTSVYLNSVWIRYSLHKQVQIEPEHFFQVMSMEGTKLNAMCFVIYKCNTDHVQIHTHRVCHKSCKLSMYIMCLKWSDGFLKGSFNRNFITWILSVWPSFPSFHLFWGQGLLPSSWLLSFWIQVWKSSCRFWSDIILSCMLIAAWSCLVWWIWVPGS